MSDTPHVRAELVGDEHIDMKMPRVVETDRAIIVLVVRRPHDVVDGEHMVATDLHVSDDVPSKLVAEFLRTIADAVEGADVT